MDHLYQTQKDDILKFLQKKYSMFDGTLWVYPHKKFHINVDPDTKPAYLRPYPVPLLHLSTFKKELDHLVKLGVSVHQKKVSGIHLPLLYPKSMEYFSESATFAN